MPKELCANCGKELGILKFKPKKEWEVTGKLCKDCFRKRNNPDKIEKDEKNIPILAPFNNKLIIR
jgi:NMD protein affecting ribosome stability and mRNA decay